MDVFLLNKCIAGFESTKQGGSQPAKGGQMDAGQPSVDSRRCNAGAAK